MLELASGEDHCALIVAEHTTHIDSERRVGELASPGEVAQHLIPASVLARDRTVARHVPDHVVGEHRAHRLLVASAIEVILVIVEVADQLRVRMRISHPATLPRYGMASYSAFVERSLPPKIEENSKLAVFSKPPLTEEPSLPALLAMPATKS